MGVRKQGPPGTAWCSKHKRFLPVAEFTRDSSRWNGLDSTCADCRKKARDKATRPRKQGKIKKTRARKKGITKAQKNMRRY